MTQLQLSDLTKMRQGTISEMARGVREQVSLPNLAKIADALDIDDITKLIGMKKEKETEEA